MLSIFQGLTAYTNNADGLDKTWSNALQISHDHVKGFDIHES